MNRTMLLIIAVVMLAAISVYFYFDPNDSAFFPRCPFLSLTGYQCPGCGSQRAIHALLHGDFAAAWGKNALLVASLPLLFLLVFSEMTRTRFPRLYRRVNSGIVIKGCFVVVVVWWILRNLIHQ